MFEACQTRRCVDVEIIDDTVEEPEEVFTYTLRRTPDLDARIELNPVDGQVEIVDDDREYEGKKHFQCFLPTLFYFTILFCSYLSLYSTLLYFTLSFSVLVILSHYIWSLLLPHSP